jgi:hypothetical protein
MKPSTSSLDEALGCSGFISLWRYSSLRISLLSMFAIRATTSSRVKPHIPLMDLKNRNENSDKRKNTYSCVYINQSRFIQYNKWLKLQFVCWLVSHTLRSFSLQDFVIVTLKRKLQFMTFLNITLITFLNHSSVEAILISLKLIETTLISPTYSHQLLYNRN